MQKQRTTVRGPVTGDAVQLDLPAAALGMRVLSGLIDLFCIWTLAIGLLWLVTRLDIPWDRALIAATITTLTVVALVIWPTAFETLSGGRSPGKYVTGLRVIRFDGGPITFQHAFTRAMIGVPELIMFNGMPALLSAAISPHHQRMADRIAGTVVIQLRLPWPEQQGIAMPPHLDAWAAAADLDRIPEQWRFWCHQLIRRQGMVPASRAVAMHDLVVGIAPWVLPPPPPATDEEIVTAITAEHCRRAAARMQRDQQIRDRLVGTS